MYDYKHWLTSKGVWTAILGGLLQLLTILNVHWLDGLDVGIASDHLVNIASGALFILAAIFRATATTKLTK